jgi:hypothetical protein
MRAAVLIAVLAVGCGPRPAPKPTALFPKTGEVPGWSRRGDTRTFEAGNLWQYNDGDADRYVQAGVEKLLTTDYRYQDKTDVVADIYIMKTAAGAKTILESESELGSQAVQVGMAGRLYGTSVTFRQDRYFVRLVAYEEAPQLPPALVDLGRAIEARLR